MEESACLQKLRAGGSVPTQSAFRLERWPLHLICSMDPFSYLSVLISIVLALGMTRVLQGLGEMLQARSHRRVYWVHAVWVLNIFLFLVVAWWVFYRWRFEQNWTFFLFVFVLISPTILYLCSLLLFPREGDVSVKDYKTHYYANHRAFFTVFALFVPVDVVDTLLKGVPHFVAQGPQYVISGVILFSITMAGAITRNETYHKVLAIYCLCHIVWISFAIFHTLQ